MTTAKSVKVEAMPESHHGVPVLHLRSEDAIPSPRSPERYAIRIGPDLARSWLLLNHANNRKARPAAFRRYARDMAEGNWQFTPEAIIFSASGVLQDGQNRLLAVIESGAGIWFTVEFGWHENLIQVVDRGVGRTNSDALNIDGIRNSTVVSAAMSTVFRYDATVDSHRSWQNSAPTSSEAIEAYRSDFINWDKAGTIGRHVYVAVEKGLGASTWAAAFYIINRENARAEAFFEELTAGTGRPESPSRRLFQHYLRRAAVDSRTGDKREPIENIVRAFNAWAANKPVAFVAQPGFVLSAVRKA